MCAVGRESIHSDVVVFDVSIKNVLVIRVV